MPKYATDNGRVIIITEKPHALLFSITMSYTIENCGEKSETTLTIYTKIFKVIVGITIYCKLGTLSRTISGIIG